MAKNPVHDISRQWWLNEVDKAPSLIESMSEDELDNALELFEVDITPLIALAHDLFEVHENMLGTDQPQENSEDDAVQKLGLIGPCPALRALEGIDETKIENMSERELDNILALLQVGLAPAIGVLQDESYALGVAETQTCAEVSSFGDNISNRPLLGKLLPNCPPTEATFGKPSSSKGAVPYATAGLGFASAAVLLGQSGVLNLASFVEGLDSGDSEKLIALTLTAACSGIVLLVSRYTRQIRDLLNEANSIREVNIKNKAATTEMLEHKARLLDEAMTSGCQKVRDTGRLWSTRKGTEMWSIYPRWSQEVQIQNTMNGLKFEGTSRIRDVIFPRVATETALFRWYVVFRLPSTSFTECGFLPIKKFLFIEQELRALAKQENRQECIDQVIRISINRNAPVDFASEFVFTTDTESGPDVVALKYFHHHATNANVSPSGEFFRFYGQADIEKTAADCRMAFFESGGMEVTVAELREIVEKGLWPAQLDNLQYRKRSSSALVQK